MFDKLCFIYEKIENVKIRKMIVEFISSSCPIFNFLDSKLYVERI